MGLVLSVSLLLLASARAPVPSRNPSFWLDPRGVSAEEAKVVHAYVARMLEREKKLVPARRREETDLLLLVELRPRGGEFAEVSPFLSRGEQTESPPVEEAPSSAADVQITLHDLVNGGSLLDRRVVCHPPLIKSSVLADGALRAGLADVVRSMEQWAEREGAALATRLEFKLSEEDRRHTRSELAKALYDRGVLASRAGALEDALDLMAEAQPLFKEAGSRKEEGRVWEHLAFLMLSTGRDPEKAAAYARQVVKIARELSDPRAEARALASLSAFEAQRGGYDQAIRYAQSAVRMGREAGDAIAEAIGLANLAGVSAFRGGFKAAHEQQEEAMGLLAKSGNRRAEARLRLAMASVYAHIDQRDLAATLGQLEDVRTLARELGDLSLQRDVAQVRADVLYSSTDRRLLAQGEGDAIRVLKLSARLGDERGEAAALGLLGALSLRLGRSAAASEYLLQALDKGKAAGFVEGAADSLELLAGAATDFRREREVLEGVLRLREQEKDLRGQAKVLSDLSRLLSSQGETEAAWKRHREASGAVAAYAQECKTNPNAEDIRGGFVATVKSLIATRTERPYLARYLKLERMVLVVDPGWMEE